MDSVSLFFRINLHWSVLLVLENPRISPSQILLLLHFLSPFVLEFPLHIYQTLQAISMSFTYCSVFPITFCSSASTWIFSVVFIYPFTNRLFLTVHFPNLSLSSHPSLSLLLCLPLPLSVLSQIIKGSLCYSIFLYFLSLLVFIISTIFSICYCFFFMTCASISCLF